MTHPFPGPQAPSFSFEPKKRGYLSDQWVFSSWLSYSTCHTVLKSIVFILNIFLKIGTQYFRLVPGTSVSPLLLSKTYRIKKQPVYSGGLRNPKIFQMIYKNGEWA